MKFKPSVFVVGVDTPTRVHLADVPEFNWIEVGAVDWSAPVDEIYQRHFQPAIHAMRRLHTKDAVTPSEAQV